MATHLAAVAVAKGKPFEIQSRSTPKPGPNELLIAVKSVALNPADVHMRDLGLFVPAYPTVIGFDISGLVLEVGSKVPVNDTDKSLGPLFRPGLTRVAAYVAFFWKPCNPNYGAFQEQCIVPWQHVVPVPDHISWNQAATLPVAVEVALSAFDALGIPRGVDFKPTSLVSSPGTMAEAGITKDNQKHKQEKRDVLLIWGASSSVGTMGVQSARILRNDANSSFAAVYATAGIKNKEYVESLGADRVFDHNDPNVEDAVVSAARQDGLTIRHCFLATGHLALCQAVLKAFRENGRDIKMEKSRIASAPVIPSDAMDVGGIETVFLMPSMDEKERLAQFHYWLGTWLKLNLANGAITPSPNPRIVGKGLGAINTGLDLLRAGVSCAKLVVELEE